jgi:hypothetical protein
LNAGARLNLFILGGAAACAVFSYLWGPPILEDFFDGVVFVTKYGLGGLLQGSPPYWIPQLGIGVPNSHPQSLALHPLSFVFLIFRLDLANCLFIFFHVALSLFLLRRIFEFIDLTATSTAVVLLAFLLSSPNLDYTLVAFWPSIYVQWALFPLLFYLLLRWLNASSWVEQRKYLLPWILVSALVFLSSHPGNFVSFVLCVAVFAALCIAARWKDAAQYRTLAAFCAGSVVIAVICLEKLLSIWTELGFFGAGTIRTGMELVYYDHVTWQLLFRPLVMPKFDGGLLSTLGGALDESVRRSTTTFVPFFGAPLFIMSLLGILLSVGALVTGKARAAAWVAAAGTLLFALLAPKLPERVFLGVPSGASVFRDPMVFFGILLAGLTLSSLERWGQRRLLRWIVVCAAAWLGIGSAPVLHSVISKQLASQAHPMPHGLRRLGLEEERARSGIGKYVQDKHDRIYLYRSPFEPMTVADAGFNVFGGFVKGVSLEVLYQSKMRMYGFIPGDTEYFVGPEYSRKVPDADNLLLKNKPALDLLSVNWVIADPAASYSSAFRHVGQVVTQDGRPGMVLRNDAAWPKAFLASPSIRELRVPKRADCWHGRFLCGDFEALLTLPAGSDRVAIERDGELIRCRFAASGAPRTLVVNEMYRPGWRVLGGAHHLETFPVLEALVGVDVPAGVTELTLGYRPPYRVVARYVALLGMLGTLLAAIWWSVVQSGHRAAAKADRQSRSA